MPVLGREARFNATRSVRGPQHETVAGCGAPTGDSRHEVAGGRRRRAAQLLSEDLFQLAVLPQRRRRVSRCGEQANQIAVRLLAEPLAGEEVAARSSDVGDCLRAPTSHQPTKSHGPIGRGER